MHISKLIITPTVKGLSNIISYEPKVETASMLIKERLSSGARDDSIPRVVFRKLPKCIRGWVNPEYLVIKK